MLIIYLSLINIIRLIHDIQCVTYSNLSAFGLQTAHLGVATCSSFSFAKLTPKWKLSTYAEKTYPGWIPTTGNLPYPLPLIKIKGMGTGSIITNRQLPLTLAEKGIPWICCPAYRTLFNLCGMEM